MLPPAPNLTSVLEYEFQAAYCFGLAHGSEQSHLLLSLRTKVRWSKGFNSGLSVAGNGQRQKKSRDRSKSDPMESPLIHFDPLPVPTEA